MSYDIVTGMLPRRRRLRDSDASRFGSLRLVVQTQGLDAAVCSVVIERIGGGRIDGTRLAFSTIPRRDADGRPLEPVELLALALDRLRSKP